MADSLARLRSLLAFYLHLDIIIHKVQLFSRFKGWCFHSLLVQGQHWLRWWPWRRSVWSYSSGRKLLGSLRHRCLWLWRAIKFWWSNYRLVYNSIHSLHSKELYRCLLRLLPPLRRQWWGLFRSESYIVAIGFGLCATGTFFCLLPSIGWEVQLEVRFGWRLFLANGLIDVTLDLKHVLGRRIVFFSCWFKRQRN